MSNCTCGHSQKKHRDGEGYCRDKIETPNKIIGPYLEACPCLRFKSGENNVVVIRKESK